MKARCCYVKQMVERLCLLHNVVNSPGSIFVCCALIHHHPSIRVEKRPNSTANIFVTVPGDMTQKAFDDAIQEVSKNPSLGLTGFRTGAKVPQEYVINAAGGELAIKNKALENLCDSALNEAVKKSELRAVGQVGFGLHGW